MSLTISDFVSSSIGLSFYGDFCNLRASQYKDEGIAYQEFDEFEETATVITPGKFSNLAYSTELNTFLYTNVYDEVFAGGTGGNGNVAILKRDNVENYSVGRSTSFIARGESDDEFLEYFILVVPDFTDVPKFYAAGIKDEMGSEWVLNPLTSDHGSTLGPATQTVINVWGADTGLYGKPYVVGAQTAAPNDFLFVAELNFDFKLNKVTFERANLLELTGTATIARGLSTTVTDGGILAATSILDHNNNTLLWTMIITDTQEDGLSLQIGGKEDFYFSDPNADFSGCLPNTGIPVATTTTTTTTTTSTTSTTSTTTTSTTNTANSIENGGCGSSCGCNCGCGNVQRLRGCGC